jgi:hypothetical protein
MPSASLKRLTSAGPPSNFPSMPFANPDERALHFAKRGRGGAEGL